MEFKYCVLLVVVLFGTTTAYPRRISCVPCEQPICYSSLAAPIPAFYETIDYDCNCLIPDVCNDQLILPPLAVELPPGLGYFPSALPLVAKYFEPAVDYLTTGAYLPIAGGCDCLTIAAPVSPDLAPLVKPIIL